MMCIWKKAMSDSKARKLEDARQKDATTTINIIVLNTFRTKNSR